jgi:RNA polymerase sigma-70 factor (ECF subfamily)
LEAAPVPLPPTGRVSVDELVRIGERGVLLDEVVRAAYEAHERELFSHALRATRDAEVAAELVQETYLRLVAELRAGNRPEQVRPWLYRVLTNMLISRNRHRSVVDRWWRGLRQREETVGPPEHVVIAHETQRAVEESLAGLDRDARVALLLAARGFSGPEIAAHIGRSHAATRTLLCRARMQVRASLQGQEPG